MRVMRNHRHKSDFVVTTINHQFGASLIASKVEVEFVQVRKPI